MRSWNVAAATALHRPVNPVRVVTAASRFDGHDAAINIIRRLLQAQGAEVIHLGHDRSVAEVVAAVVEEDADAVAVSSYQGGHVEYFGYLVERLRAEGMGHVGVYGGGGGVITTEEIELLATKRRADLLAGRRAAARPRRDGQRDPRRQRPAHREPHGPARPRRRPPSWSGPGAQRHRGRHAARRRWPTRSAALAAGRRVPVLGITGPGGAGKSTLTDELVLRFRLDQEDKLRLVVLAVDPSKRRTGGALLGDRIRMNAIDSDQVVVRSIASRSSGTELPASMPLLLDAARRRRAPTW